MNTERHGFLLRAGRKKLSLGLPEGAKITPGENVKLTKRHAIKPITTRKYYPGVHALEILINGKTFGQYDWVTDTK